MYLFFMIRVSMCPFGETGTARACRKQHIYSLLTKCTRNTFYVSSIEYLCIADITLFAPACADVPAFFDNNQTLPQPTQIRLCTRVHQLCHTHIHSQSDPNPHPPLTTQVPPSNWLPHTLTSPIRLSTRRPRLCWAVPQPQVCAG